MFIAWQAGPWRRVQRWGGWSALIVMATAADLLAFSWGIHPRESLTTISTPHSAVAAIRELLAAQESGSASPGESAAAPGGFDKTADVPLN